MSIGLYLGILDNFAPMDSLSLFSRLQLAKWVIKEGAFNPRQALKNEIAIPGMTAKAAGKVTFLLLKKTQTYTLSL